MAIHRRSAIFDAVLVYLDEPQIVTLISQKTRVVAIAIPYENPNIAMFHATTVAEKDWERYLSGTVDLRYLFTFPTVRVHYYFDLHALEDGKIMMSPWIGDIGENYLPLPRFFSSNHTEEYKANIRATDRELLVIDGEWELTDFGQFQQKYSDIYAFIIATKNWLDAGATLQTKRRVKDAFLNRPFQGGFSYVHLFRDLSNNVSRPDQLNLSKIKYASPGEVEIFGKEEIFEEIHQIIPNFLHKRERLQEDYRTFHQYLSENHYLRIHGDHYPKGDPTEAYMSGRARKLAVEMLAPNFDAVWDLTNGNALVASKVVLSFYRRLADAAAYFAQGRVAYTDI
ncbi:hypothetical protein [Mesorhizobium sp. M0254]|uniref:hypothetical protein n=1 Tax=Mesorhizobium sp. M0254 TaxID=2956927 RepID=UPI003336AAF3